MDISSPAQAKRHWKCRHSGLAGPGDGARNRLRFGFPAEAIERGPCLLAAADHKPLTGPHDLREIGQNPDIVSAPRLAIVAALNETLGTDGDEMSCSVSESMRCRRIQRGVHVNRPVRGGRTPSHALLL